MYLHAITPAATFNPTLALVAQASDLSAFVALVCHHLGVGNLPGVGHLVTLKGTAVECCITTAVEVTEVEFRIATAVEITAVEVTPVVRETLRNGGEWQGSECG